MQRKRREYRPGGGPKRIKRITVNEKNDSLTIIMPLSDLRSSQSPDKLERLLAIYKSRGYRIVRRIGRKEEVW